MRRGQLPPHAFVWQAALDALTLQQEAVAAEQLRKLCLEQVEGERLCAPWRIGVDRAWPGTGAPSQTHEIGSCIGSEAASLLYACLSAMS